MRLWIAPPLLALVLLSFATGPSVVDAGKIVKRQADGDQANATTPDAVDDVSTTAEVTLAAISYDGCASCDKEVFEKAEIPADFKDRTTPFLFKNESTQYLQIDHMCILAYCPAGYTMRNANGSTTAAEELLCNNKSWFDSNATTNTKKRLEYAFCVKPCSNPLPAPEVEGCAKNHACNASLLERNGTRLQCATGYNISVKSIDSAYLVGPGIVCDGANDVWKVRNTAMKNVTATCVARETVTPASNHGGGGGGGGDGKGGKGKGDNGGSGDDVDAVSDWLGVPIWAWVLIAIIILGIVAAFCIGFYVIMVVVPKNKERRRKNQRDGKGKKKDKKDKKWKKSKKDKKEDRDALSDALRLMTKLSPYRKGKQSKRDENSTAADSTYGTGTSSGTTTDGATTSDD